eukprot:2875377-Lingulodinium_polyedra.AAC.1
MTARGNQVVASAREAAPSRRQGRTIALATSRSGGGPLRPGLSCIVLICRPTGGTPAARNASTTRQRAALR